MSLGKNLQFTQLQYSVSNGQDSLIETGHDHGVTLIWYLISIVRAWDGCTVDVLFGKVSTILKDSTTFVYMLGGL